MADNDNLMNTSLTSSKKDFHLDELQQIDQMYEQIENEITELAEQESVEVDYLEDLLETAAAADDAILTMGGLDKIVEMDGSGGGE